MITLSELRVHLGFQSSSAPLSAWPAAGVQGEPPPRGCCQIKNVMTSYDAPIILRDSENQPGAMIGACGTEAQAR